MSKKFKRIGVLTSGGDAPGMNAAVRAVARFAITNGVEVMGIYEGYKGLVENKMKLLGLRDVANIIYEGGTILYSERCLDFKTPEGMQKALDVCAENKIEGIVAIGGDGTFRGATDLASHGIPCIGIPGTIDNDITSTDYSIGFDTAMNTVIQMVDRLRDTCESHARCNVVEVMGRDAGYIALEAGIAVGASSVVVKEIPFNEEEAIEKIKLSKEQGKRNFIILVAEGVAGYAEKLTETIEKTTGIPSRFARLGHVVRGGSPSLRDRLIAAKMGVKAVEMLLEGKSNLVVCERKSEIVTTDIHYALMLDKMYKGTIKQSELDALSPGTIAELEAFCDMRRREIVDLYRIADNISC